MGVLFDAPITFIVLNNCKRSLLVDLHSTYINVKYRGFL